MRFAGTQLSNFLGNTMDYSMISGASMNGRAKERQAVMGAEGMVANAGVNSMAKIKSAEAQAEAIAAGGAAAGQSSMASGIGSMVSGIVGAFG